MKILIIDDSQSWVEFHKNILEEIYIMEENILHTAFSARQALDTLYQNTSTPYDLIITDLQMEEDFSPLFAGEWIIEQIKNLTSFNKSRIIISSGAYNIKHIANSFNVEYIPKRIACTDRLEYERIILNG